MIAFDSYGLDVTAEILQCDDSITCACSNSTFIAVGTTRGFVHIMDLVSKIAILLGPYAGPIKHLAAFHDTVAFITHNSLTVFDIEQEYESLNTDISQLERVGVCGKNGPKTGVICGRANEILVVNKGWVRVSVTPLPIRVNGLKDLKVHFSLLCVLDADCLQLLNLKTDQVVWSFSMLTCNNLLFHWLSPSNLAVVADDSLAVLEYSQGPEDSFRTTKSITLPSIPLRLGQFNQKYLVYLDDRSLYIVDIDQNENVSAELPFSGFLITPTKSNSPFFIAGPHRFLKVSPQTIKEKINYLLRNNRMAEALRICKKCNIPVERMLDEHLEYLTANEKTEEIQQLVKEAALTDPLWVKIIDYFLANGRIHLVALEIPAFTDYVQAIIAQLIETGHIEIINTLIEQWPNFLSPATHQVFLSGGLHQQLIRLYMKSGDVNTAFNIGLHAKLEDVFDLLETHPSLTSYLHENQTLLQPFFEISPEKAAECLETRRTVFQASEVLRHVSEDLVVSYVQRMLELERSEALETEFFGILVRSDSSELSEFIKKARYLNLHEALRKAKKLGHQEAQFLVLRKLERFEEAKAILQEHFDLRMKYIALYPDLWTITFAQALDDPEKVPSVIQQLGAHRNPAAFVEQVPWTNVNTEISGVLDSVQGQLQVHLSASQAFSAEISNVFQTLHKESLQPVKVQKPFICSVCVQRLAGSIYVRKCGHHSHAVCATHCVFCKEIVY